MQWNETVKMRNKLSWHVVWFDRVKQYAPMKSFALLITKGILVLELLYPYKCKQVLIELLHISYFLW